MGISLEKNCGNCEYTSCSTLSAPCLYCREFNNWVPDAYMRNKYTPNQLRGMVLCKPKTVPAIKDVIFNPPATIVKWDDGTKTVVKCHGDDMFDPEKGLAMAIAKKSMGNNGSYFNHIKKWTEKYHNSIKIELDFSVAPSFSESILKASENAQKALRAIANSVGRFDTV